MKQGIPASVKQFCSRAKSTGEGNAANGDFVMKHGSYLCHVIPASHDMISFDIIHGSDLDFQGAALCILKLKEVCILVHLMCRGGLFLLRYCPL